MEPAVSIIMPCFNSGKYLGQAIESVIGQTWADFEVIVVNDGSTDNTAEVVSAFKDDRIKYVCQPNRGLAGARNTGIRRSKGRFLTFLDADDVFLPDKLLIQTRLLEQETNIGLCAGNHQRLTPVGRIFYVPQPLSGILSARQVLCNNPFPVHATMIRREWLDRIGLFDESLAAAEDWDFHCRLAVAGCRMLRHADVVCAYRTHEQSMSFDVVRQSSALLRVVQKTFADPCLPPELSRERPKAQGLTHVKIACMYYALGGHDEGQSHLRQAMEYDPSLAAEASNVVLRQLMSRGKVTGEQSGVLFVRRLTHELPLCIQNQLHNRWFSRHVRSELMAAIKARNIMLASRLIRSAVRCRLSRTATQRRP